MHTTDILFSRNTNTQKWFLLSRETPMERSKRIKEKISSKHYLVEKEIGEGNGTLFQYSCLENPMDGGAW